MPAITLEAINAKQVELNLLIAKFKEQASQTTVHTFAQVDITLRPGEHYAGAVLDADGKHLHHLILMSAKPDDILNWQDAMDWSISVGGCLPNRQEQALLYANCKPHLEGKWHWSCESHTDASYAWHCDFGNGDQCCSHKSYEGCAVAVRRV